MDWRPVQGVPRLSPDDRWDRLQPPCTPTDGLSGYRKWMDGFSAGLIVFNCYSCVLIKQEQETEKYDTYIFFFVLHHGKQNYNRNTVLCQTHLLCQGKLYESNAPLDCQVLLINLFLFQYFMHNNAEPDGGTEREAEQRKGNETEIEKNYREKTKKNKTKSSQLAATSVETKQKTSCGLCGETRQRIIRTTCR